ncbi:hypothetical protein V8E51_011622 [Hyaloscypha variabilis]
MQPSMVSTVLVLLSVLAPSVVAIASNLDSPCAIQCGNVQGTTTGSDIVCNNGDFTSTPVGITFQSCVTCQLGSTYVAPGTNVPDLQLGLYNLRYAVSWCLFGYPNNTNVGNTPCITSTACQPLESAIEFDSLSSQASEYGYCALMNTVSVPKCNACLAVQTNQFYINNFVIALAGACQQQPSPGHTISLQGSLFSTTTVNITSPTAAATGTYTPSNTKFPLGAKIGVAVGGVLLLLSVLGCLIIWRGKQRRRSFLLRHQQQTGYADWVAAQQTRSTATTPGFGSMSQAMPPPSEPQSAGAFFDSPLSQRALVPNAAWGSGRAEDESPAEKVYFSPYTSQYNSPVSAVDQIQVVSQQWPLDRKGSVDRAFGSGGVRNRSRSPNREKNNQFELQNVAPVLHHPGHGRQDSNNSLGLTEDDHRRGDAV